MSVARAFLFADLRDYTAFIENAGDRAAAELIRDFRAIVRERLARHEGAELKTEGDSFYLVFPGASGAIAFAVDVMRTADSGGRPMRFGIGIHAGETVPLEGQFVGSAVNLAARIGAAATAGEILVSDTVRGLVRTAVAHPLVDRGFVPLKGIAEPVRVFAVEWRERPVAEERLVPKTEALLSPEVIGRDRELATLLAIVAELGHGQGRIVTIAGTAGVGKTRFVGQLAGRTDVSVWLGECGATDARPLYEPFAAMLRRATRAPEGEARLRRVAPELLALLPELSAGERARQTDRDTLFGAFLRFVRDHSRNAPVALVVEDLHWADDATLALFRFLAAEAVATPYLVVATYRDDELHRGHALRPLLAELSRRADTSQIALQPLDLQASRELLTGLRLASPVPDTERDRIVALAEGNPLFLEELARTVAHDTGPLPLSIAEAVLRRVVSLDEASRRLVTYAAVSGLLVRFELLERLLGADEREVLRAARSAVEQSLLVETEEGLAFRHPLTREAIYRDLMRRERRLLHREIAEALAALRGGDPAAAREIELQFLEAGAPREALPYALAAGRHALSLLASAEAVEHFERAVDAAPADSLDKANALEGLGAAYRLRLHVAKSAATMRDALDLYRRVGTKADLVRAQIGLARVLPYSTEEWEAWRAAWKLADDASAAQRFQIANTLADRAYQFMRDEEAKEWNRVASELATGLGGQATETVRRNSLEIGHPAEWHRETERIHRLQLDRALAHDEPVLVAYRRFLDSRCREATVEEREEILSRARSYVDQHAPGVPRTVIFRFGVPWQSWLSGRWDRIDGMWAEMRERFSPDDLPEIFPDTGPIAAAIRMEREGPPAAGGALREAAIRQSRAGTWDARLGGGAHHAHLLLAEGRPQKVVEELAPAVLARGPQALGIGALLLTSRVLLPAALLTRDEDVTSAFVAADASLRPEGPTFGAALDHAHAIAAMVAGDEESARERFASAAGTYERLGWEHLAAELAWQRARAGDVSALSRAIAFYEERGAAWRAAWLSEGGWR